MISNNFSLANISTKVLTKHEVGLEETYRITNKSTNSHTLGYTNKACDTVTYDENGSIIGS